MRKLPVCLALPGAGTALGVVAGACEALSESFTFAATGGTSGGGLVALALAVGIPAKEVSRIIGDMLQRTDLLDKGWPFDKNPGLYRGNVISKILQTIFGDARMKDLNIPSRVCIVDLTGEVPAIIDSMVHPNVLVWKAARATMSIEFFFDPSPVHDDNPLRLCGDGGLSLNVPAGLWDDMDKPTVSMRFAHQQPELALADLIRNGHLDTVAAQNRRVSDWESMVKATTNVMLKQACITLPSMKPHSKFAEVVLRTKCDGMKFGLDRGEVDVRRLEGFSSAVQAKLWHLMSPED